MVFYTQSKQALQKTPFTGSIKLPVNNEKEAEAATYGKHYL